MTDRKLFVVRHPGQAPAMVKFLDDSNYDVCWPGSSLVGNRYEKIVIPKAYLEDAWTLEWFREYLLTRLIPAGKVLYL